MTRIFRREFGKVATLGALCLFAALPAQSDLIHHWTFDGDVNDSGSVPYTGTLAGAGGPVGLPTVSGGVLTLDGVDDYVSFGPTAFLVPIAPEFGPLSFTIMLNAEFSGFPGSDFFSQGGGGHALYMGPDGTEMRVTDNYHFWDDLGKTPVNGGGCGSGADNCTGIATPADGAWHNYALTVDGSNAAFYIDGILQATRAGFILSDGGIPFVLGRQFNSSEYFGGSLSDVRIYDTALSGAEITDVTAAPEPQSFVLLLSAMSGVILLRRKLRA